MRCLANSSNPTLARMIFCSLVPQRRRCKELAPRLVNQCSRSAGLRPRTHPLAQKGAAMGRLKRNRLIRNAGLGPATVRLSVTSSSGTNAIRMLQPACTLRSGPHAASDSSIPPPLSASWTLWGQHDHFTRDWPSAMNQVSSASPCKVQFRVSSGMRGLAARAASPPPWCLGKLELIRLGRVSTQRARIHSSHEKSNKH